MCLFEGPGIQWSTINQPVTVDDNFTMFDVIGMLIFDSLLYGLITWYVEAVFPGEYGIPEVWYFFILVSRFKALNHIEAAASCSGGGSCSCNVVYTSTSLYSLFLYPLDSPIINCCPGLCSSHNTHIQLGLIIQPHH